MLSDPGAISSLITDYYQSLFSSQDSHIDDGILDCIPSLITSDHNQQLLQFPTLEEVEKVVFGLSAVNIGAPGILWAFLYILLGCRSGHYL